MLGNPIRAGKPGLPGATGKQGLRGRPGDKGERGYAGEKGSKGERVSFPLESGGLGNRIFCKRKNALY